MGACRHLLRITPALALSACSLLDWDQLERPRAGAPSTLADAGAGGDATALNGEGGVGATEADGGVNAYAQAVLEDGPEAYLRFDDDAASGTVRDATGRHAGSYPGTMVRDLEGAVGRAVGVSGKAANLALIGAISGAGNAPFTVECWGYLENGQTGFTVKLGEEIDLIFGDVSTAKPGVLISRHCCGYWDHPATVDVPTGRWVHLAGTYDGLKLTMFVDGVGVDWVSSPGALPGSKWTPALALYAGARIDELAFYTKALSEDRVVAHCKAAGKCQ